MVQVPIAKTPPNADNPVYRIRHEGKEYIQLHNPTTTIPFSKENVTGLHLEDKDFRYYAIHESGDWFGPFPLDTWTNADMENICPRAHEPLEVCQ